MGHYLSEMESDAEWERRNARHTAVISWQGRGYKNVSYDTLADKPLVHEPCGTMVGYKYTEVHDQFCPARSSDVQ